MSSQAQIDANRINSQKSTGPTSPAGKAVSSLNALKSGIDAQSEIIRDEDPAALAALSAAFHLEFHPVGPNQLALVDTLIAAEWTQRRLRRIEAQLWTTRDRSYDPSYAEESATPNPPTRFLPLGHSFPDALDPFLRIQRRINGTNRLYLRTLQVLQDLRKATMEPPRPPCRPAAQAPESAPRRLSHLPHQLASFRHSLLHTENRRPRVVEITNLLQKESLETDRARVDQGPRDGYDS